MNEDILMPLDNFGVAGPGVYRSAQPDKHGFGVIRDLSIDVVCKLSRDDEFPNAQEITELKGANVMIHDTFPVWSPDRVYVERLVGEIADIVRDGHRVLIHCMKGRDRTGLLCAAYQLIVLRQSLDAVMDEFNSYRTTPFSYIGDINVRGLLSEIARDRGKP